MITFKQWSARPIALSLAMFAAIGVAASPAQAEWENTRPENRVAQIRFRNNNVRSLYALYIAPRYSSEWRELLGSKILKSGETIDVELNYEELYKAGCNYRIKAVYSDGSEAVLEDQPYDLCGLRQVQFGPYPSINPLRPN
ncbi:MAG: hypothetical protein EA001_02560 [Oscillatoriales cyanobacterium]|nr:MAG: hypothetical protein EA001_02560 [Oscillatoriales cyanobacterium]